MHFDTSPLERNFCTPSVINPAHELALCQDPSHNIKKLRNNLINSGMSSYHSKKLSKNGRYIYWCHFKNAIEWDRTTNSRPLHNRVTNVHLNPTNSEKMRNHLAEEMLNYDMLNVMKHYQTQHSTPDELTATLELLDVTSKMIMVFRDRLPITNLTDVKLVYLKEAYTWFSDWKKYVRTKHIVTHSNKNFIKICKTDHNQIIGFVQKHIYLRSLEK